VDPVISTTRWPGDGIDSRALMSAGEIISKVPMNKASPKTSPMRFDITVVIP
jgi:hypothetical protein